jgi:hypothetical protein
VITCLHRAHTEHHHFRVQRPHLVANRRNHPCRRPSRAHHSAPPAAQTLTIREVDDRLHFGIEAACVLISRHADDLHLPFDPREDHPLAHRIFVRKRGPRQLPIDHHYARPICHVAIVEVPACDQWHADRTQIPGTDIPDREAKLLRRVQEGGAWRITQVDATGRVKTLIPYGTPVQ